MKVYSGIGSRQTPADVLGEMRVIAAQLAKAGFILSTGGAGGADSNFELGARGEHGGIQLWLPWPGFNRRHQDIASDNPSREALMKAQTFLGDKHWNGMMASFLRKNQVESIEAYEALCQQTRRPSRIRHGRATSKDPFVRHWCPAHLLHARNFHQILGGDLRSPVEFVVAWAPVKYGKPQGGTATGILLAEENYITVYNLFLKERRQQFLEDALPAYLRGERLTTGGA